MLLELAIHDRLTPATSAHEGRADRSEAGEHPGGDGECRGTAGDGVLPRVASGRHPARTTTDQIGDFRRRLAKRFRHLAG